MLTGEPGDEAERSEGDIQGDRPQPTMSRILIVEDDTDIAALIAHYLDKSGLQL